MYFIWETCWSPSLIHYYTTCLVSPSNQNMSHHLKTLTWACPRLEHRRLCLETMDGPRPESEAKFGVLRVFLSESFDQGRIRGHGKSSTPENPVRGKPRVGRMHSRCEKLRRPEGNGQVTLPTGRVSGRRPAGRRDNGATGGRAHAEGPAGMKPWYVRPQSGSRSQGHPANACAGLLDAADQHARGSSTACCTSARPPNPRWPSVRMDTQYVKYYYRLENKINTHYSRYVNYYITHLYIIYKSFGTCSE